MPPTQQQPGRRLVIHVGLHKTGTTYLQSLWRANRSALAKQGVYYPGAAGEPVPRLAVIDLLGQRPRGVRNDQRLPGQWAALSEAIAQTDLGTTLISAEGLSVATPRQAVAAVSSFPDHEVHVLVTCRDLGRVLVSAWQEAIKNDHTWSWEEYVAAVKDPGTRARSPARGFWLQQDLPGVLDRWGGAVPVERLHVVTVPAAGASPDLLLSRVASVVGFDAATLTEPPAWDNTSVGTAGIEVVRRLNVALEHTLNQRQHDHVVKGVLVPYLVRHGTDRRFGLPPEELAWVEAEARRHMAAVRSGGYPVVGDLDDLLPRTELGRANPGDASTEELLEASLVALTGLARRHAGLWWRVRKDETSVVEPSSRRLVALSAVRAVSFRARRAAAALVDRHQVAAGAADRYLAAKQRRRARRTHR